MTHRNDPMLQATYEGMQANESGFLTAVPREAEIIRQVALPGIKKVNVTVPAGGALHAGGAVEKPYEGVGKYVGPAKLGSDAGGYNKQIITFDADTDTFDPIQMEWGVAPAGRANRQ